MTQNRFVAVDVESTGFSPARGDRVIEVGAVIIENRRITDEFHSLVNVGRRIPLTATRVHGITDDMLLGKPGPDEVFPQFRKFLGASALVAHNASFDVSFLRHEFSRLGFGLNNPCHCTLVMSRRRFPNLRDHKLETVYRHLCGALPHGVTLHRALDDARMVARVWMEMMKK
jgi:DNA polymerase-3 subunit epsilon